MKKMTLGFTFATVLALVLSPLGIGLSFILPASISVTTDGKLDEGKIKQHLAEVTSDSNGGTTLGGIPMRQSDPEYAERFVSAMNDAVSKQYYTTANFVFVTQTSGYLTACGETIVWHIVSDDEGSWLIVDAKNYPNFTEALRHKCYNEA